MTYSWQAFGDESSPLKIAIVATSSGFEPSAETNGWIAARAAALNALGFCVYVPKYEDGSLVFEKGISGVVTQVGGSRDRGVSPETGVAQIIDCAKNGWDIFPFMGGKGFVDKVGAVVDHFKGDVKKPAKPIRIFNFSDCTYAAFLQSHHPDIFRFYSTMSSRDLYRDPATDKLLSAADADAGLDEGYKAIRDRNREALTLLMREDKIAPYPREVLHSPHMGITAEAVQYFPLHSDMIWADAIAFDSEVGGGKVAADGSEGMGQNRFGHRLVPHLPFNRLDTSRPYILGLEMFLQQPADKKKYDNNFPKYLEEFLRERAARKSAHSELPVAVEIGLIESRLDGANGYATRASRLHDEKTGLIAINDFNIDRIFVHRVAIANQIKEILVAEKVGEDVPTKVPESVAAKVVAGVELDKSDIQKILECENEKILEMRKRIVEVCAKYGVTAIMNGRCGHSLNLGVTGGGLVNFKMREGEAVLEHVPSYVRVLPGSEPSVVAASAATVAATGHGAGK